MAGPLFTADGFPGFGPSRFHPAGHVPLGKSIRQSSEKKLRELVRDHAPRAPGVYGMLDKHGQLIYVGKAKALRTRLLSYFRTESRDPKAGRILQQTRTLIWEHATSEFAALVRELELIRRFRPRFNVIGRPDLTRYHYVCVGRAPAPYAYLTRQPTGAEIAVFGPVVGIGWLPEAVRRLNDLFGLRDCSQKQALHFADQPELFPVIRSPGCLRYELGTCLGPCVAGTSRAGYMRQVRAVQDFLAGVDVIPLTQLEAEMNAAATAFQFERAAALRDKLADLRRLIDRLTWLQQARAEHSFVYPLTGADHATLWYVIHRGRIEAVLPQPRTARDRAAAAKFLEATFARQTAEIGTMLPVAQVDSVLLVAAWFRKHAGERRKLLTKDDALRWCAAGTAVKEG